MLWVTKTWTWLYIGTQDAWAVFIIVVYFSKYSNIKLGKPDDKPEYGDATYFTMLFAAGIGIGLFYFEPIWHYEPGRHGNLGEECIDFNICPSFQSQTGGTTKVWTLNIFLFEDCVSSCRIFYLHYLVLKHN